MEDTADKAGRVDRAVAGRVERGVEVDAGAAVVEAEGAKETEAIQTPHGPEDTIRRWQRWAPGRERCYMPAGI